MRGRWCIGLHKHTRQGPPRVRRVAKQQSVNTSWFFQRGSPIRTRPCMRRPDHNLGPSDRDALASRELNTKGGAFQLDKLTKGASLSRTHSPPKDSPHNTCTAYQNLCIKILAWMRTPAYQASAGGWSWYSPQKPIALGSSSAALFFSCEVGFDRLARLPVTSSQLFVDAFDRLVH